MVWAKEAAIASTHKAGDSFEDHEGLQVLEGALVRRQVTWWLVH